MSRQTRQCPANPPGAVLSKNDTRTSMKQQNFKQNTTPPPTVHRGDIYNIESGLTIPTGTEIWPGRPAVIISNDAINEKSGFVTVVYLTTSEKRDMPYHVKVQSGKKIATALCEQVFSVDKSRLGNYVGTLSTEEIGNLDIALQLSLSTIGTNQAKCLNLIRKWILALEKHNISLMGNPADSDTQESDTVRRLTIERDTWQNMYRQQVNNMQKIMALNA